MEALTLNRTFAPVRRKMSPIVKIFHEDEIVTYYRDVNGKRRLKFNESTKPIAW